MELFRTDEFYVFVNGEYSLWWDRQTGAFIPKTGWDLTSAEDPHCLGVFYGIVGKVEHQSVFDSRLILIKESSPIGKIHGDHIVHKIKSVVFLQTSSDNTDPPLNQCQKHKTITSKKSPSANLFDIQKNAAFSKTWGTLKSAGSTIKSTTQQAAAIATGTPKKRDIKDKEKFEKRIVEEFHKIFTDTDSFYYCHTCDITNSLQRLCNLEKSTSREHALWKNVDDRFFWNKHMLNELIELNNPLCNPWILPIIQGFIQIEDCKVEVGQDFLGVKTSPKYEVFTLCIISRRSRFRAGTRYKRRGVDENGECANYVETEQIISYHHHEMSFVQVRGSVPVYWSQPGYKYRPPPRIDKGEAETKLAFEKHFGHEIKNYGPICVINLVEQTGKERIIWDAYSNHIFQFNSPLITYVTFDFHEYCRGMHFENVSILVNAIADLVRNMNYCWRDRQGYICSQLGVFRVNCIDCLDRTNVVQTALGKAVMELQFTKLGLISPEGVMPSEIKQTFQLLWANNGDIISKQYAGTNALKGDYTRTGERKFTGIMKDGMNSANRYYLSRFKDATRQGTIDLMLGNYVSEDIFNENRMQDEEDSAATAEHVKLLIEDCKKMLLNNPELVMGSWGLINADSSTGDPTETEMDSILILTKDSYFVADYDDQVDKIAKYQRVMLRDLTLLECGTPEASLFKTSRNHYCIRINYKVNNADGYYHMFRSTNLRFFNNMAIVIKNEEEEIESLRAICEAFVVAIDVCGLPAITFHKVNKLDKRKSKVISANRTTSSMYLDVTFPNITRNVSESQLLTLKNVGSKALSNMTQQFSKLNKLSSSFNRSRRGPPQFILGRSYKNESSSDSDEDYENSIFQPHVAVGDSNQSYIYNNDMYIESGIELTEDFNFEPKTDTFLPSVGIVMGAPEPLIVRNDEPISINTHVDSVQLSSVMETPEIQINSEASKVQPPNTLKLEHKLSHSSGEVGESSTQPATQFLAGDCRYSNSERDITLNITQSQSESALKNKLASLTSPVASATKDLVLIPFSKLAKGVQNLGVNLDPRKIALGGHHEEHDADESRKLQEKWKNCHTKLIAL